MSVVANYAVRDKESGSVLHAETLAKFTKDLEVYMANEKNDLETIGATIDAVLNTEKLHGLQSISMKTLETLTLNALGDSVEPAAIPFVASRINGYVHAHPEKFYSSRGPGGGIKILSRLNPVQLAEIEVAKQKSALKAKQKAEMDAFLASKAPATVSA